jgi:hypothetical protein
MTDLIAEKTATYVSIPFSLNLPSGILAAVKEGVAERHIVTMLRLWQRDMDIRHAYDLAESLRNIYGPKE